ncbi:MAG: hypothetical protein AB7H97_21915, partial [Pseudobdellovibrionaceae bacterium]
MKILVLILAVFASLQSFGGVTVGNGGVGLKVGNRLYLLDFVETGIEGQAVIRYDQPEMPKVRELVAKKLTPIPNVPINEITAKISEIFAVDKTLAMSLFKSIEAYDWRVVSVGLRDTDDTDSLLSYPPENLVQIAVRSERVIRINRDKWNLLDVEDRAGLIIHEALYAINYTREVGKAWTQSAIQVRSLVGHLFSKDFSVQNQESYLRLVTLAFPNMSLTGAPNKFQSINIDQNQTDLRYIVGPSSIYLGEPFVDSIVLYK